MDLSGTGVGMACDEDSLCVCERERDAILLLVLS